MMIEVEGDQDRPPEDIATDHFQLSPSYYASFMKRHPEVKSIKPVQIEKDRFENAISTNIEAYFGVLEPLFKQHNYSANMIANIDETMVNFDGKKNPK